MAELPQGTGPRLAELLLLNSLVAIMIGLAVANVGHAARRVALGGADPAEAARSAPGPMEQFIDNVPRSLLGPLTDGGSVIGVIFIAIAFGVALRRLRDVPITNVRDGLEVGFQAIIIVLRWIIEIIPFGIFGIIASIVGTKGSRRSFRWAGSSSP